MKDVITGKFVAEDPYTRFWRNVDKTEECWLWTGTITKHGYGQFVINRLRIPAHRYSYVLLKASIPSDLQIDHLCRVRHCVNPEHLEAVTLRENLIRGINWQTQKTHCTQGHPYNEENTKWCGSFRRCRTCLKEWARKKYLKRKAR